MYVCLLYVCLCMLMYVGCLLMNIMTGMRTSNVLRRNRSIITRRVKALLCRLLVRVFRARSSWIQTRARLAQAGFNLAYDSIVIPLPMCGTTVP
jgi:hypothetical protein